MESSSAVRLIRLPVRRSSRCGGFAVARALILAHRTIFGPVSLDRATAEGLLQRDRIVLPRGEDPRDEVGADSEHGEQERGEDDESHDPDVDAGHLGEATGDTTEDAVGAATETDFADGVE